MNEMDDIFTFAKEFSKAYRELSKIREEKTKQRRIKGQNNPYTKKRKSESMKKYWMNRKLQEKLDLEWEKARPVKPQECTCHLGHPPCSFCTDRNYCEDCDESTWDDECPKCGKDIRR